MQKIVGPILIYSQRDLRYKRPLRVLSIRLIRGRFLVLSSGAARLLVVKLWNARKEA